MVKLRWLKKWKIRNPGDISEVGKKSAENFVSQGYAEYLEENKPKKYTIFADLSEVEKLKKEFPAVDIDKIIENYCSYYTKKPFKSKTKVVFSQKLKKHITLHNPEWKEKGDKENKESKTYKKALAVINKENPSQKIKEIKFDFEAIEPEINIKTLEQLKQIITKYFPDSWFEFKACLSTYCTLSLKNLNGCPTLILVGMPASEKTTVESFLYGHNLSYISDEFSPRSFVSHSVAVKKEELENIDLLPKIKNKALITPELAPLFEAPREKLIESISILTRILDGEGYNKDTGAQGHRGYSGDYKFVWLGATTPLRNNFWNVAGKIGNRLFFLNMSDKKRNSEDFLKIFIGDEAYEEKVKICRGATTNFLNNFFKKYPVRELSWDNKKDIFILKSIINYAELLSKLRGSLVTWKNNEERGEYQHTFPIIEEPPRAINALINFARGHALINGRNYLHSDDLELIKRICMSSMPYDRHKFLQLILKHEGRLTTAVVEQELNCSQDVALRTMKSFQVLGIVDIKNISLGDGHPMYYVELKQEFQELVDSTQGVNGATGFSHKQGVNSTINTKSHEINPVSPRNSQSYAQNTPSTQGVNSTINTKSHEINPIHEPNLDIEYEKIESNNHFSSQSSHSSHLPVNNIKISDECVTKSDENIKKGCDECDECGENDEYIEAKGVKKFENKKNNSKINEYSNSENKPVNPEKASKVSEEIDFSFLDEEFENNPIPEPEESEPEEKLNIIYEKIK